MINSKILLSNKDPFQIKNQVQRTHLHIFCIYKRRRSKTSKNKLFPLISLIVSRRTPKTLSFSTPLNPIMGNYDYDGIDGLKDGRDVGAN